MAHSQIYGGVFPVAPTIFDTAGRLDLEGQRSPKLVHRLPQQVDLTNDHLLVGHSDDHLLAGELGERPQLLDGFGDGCCVDDLTVANRALGQRHLPELLQRDSRLAERQLCCAHA